MKTLKLTLTYDRIIYVNFNLVTDFYQADNETMICFGSEDYHFKVKESAQEIFHSIKLA